MKTTINLYLKTGATVHHDVTNMTNDGVALIVELLTDAGALDKYTLTLHLGKVDSK